MLEDLEGRQLLSQVIRPIATLPTASAYNIVSGPDGNLWVAVNPTWISSAIDRIGLNGSVTSFAVLPGGSTTDTQVASLTTGPDGNIWFDASSFTIDPASPLPPSGIQVFMGKVTPAGQITEFPPIPVSAGQNADSSFIVSGPGGNLWFDYSLRTSSGQYQDFIGRVTTTGSVTLFPISSPGARAEGVDSLEPAPTAIFGSPRAWGKAKFSARCLRRAP